MTLLAIDSASLWYRAYYGMPDTLVSPSGEPINALKGFIDAVARLANQYQPNRIAICLDGDWRPSWRVELFPDYKLNRVDDSGEEEEPDLLTPQIPVILDYFDACGIPIVGIDDYEADDVLASLAEQQRGPIRIVTGDRDLFQLVNDVRDIKVIYLAKGISAHELVGERWLAEKYSIPGSRYGLFSMIRGDASDGLPGIRGIGEKGAAKIATVYENMSDLIRAAQSDDEQLPEPMRKKILADLEYAEKVTKLVSCVRDIRLPLVQFEVPKKPADVTALDAITQKYGLGSSTQRLKAAFRWA